MMKLMDNVASGKRLVVGVGSALVDILGFGDDAFVADIGAIKGGMSLVDREHIEQVLARFQVPPAMVPGGSACNTIIGVSRLGGSARFVGRCGSGPLSRCFSEGLAESAVDPFIRTSSAPTGRVLSVVTPDAQRSMLTFLGAAAELTAADMAPDCFEEAALVHVEGYLLFNRELIMTVMDMARNAGAAVSLDLASFNVVEQSLSFLKPLVANYVDILLANEDEARAYTGHVNEREALAVMRDQVDTAVVKVGPRGSVIAHGADVFDIDAAGDGSAIDTTGAGDLWASGFFYGLLNGMDMAQCGQLGALCGYEVCQVVGASIPDDGWRRIRKTLGTDFSGSGARTSGHEEA